MWHLCYTREGDNLNLVKFLEHLCYLKEGDDNLDLMTSWLSQRGRWDWSLRAQQRQPPLGWNCPQGLKIIEHKQNMFTSWFDLIIKKKLFSEHQRSVCRLCLRGHSDQDQPQFKNHEEQILFNRTITQQVQNFSLRKTYHLHSVLKFIFIFFHTGTWFSSSWFCS